MVPIVSVIMPAYNVEKFIQQSIDSVIAQTFHEWELIVIDDGSTDRTVAVVRENQLRNDKIKLIVQENKKQAAARNAGLKAARGKWIAFLDSDDLWLPNKLATQLSFQDKADVLYCGGTIFYETKAKRKTWETEYGFFSANEMYAKLYTYNPIPNQAVLVKSQWVQKIGYQNESPEVVGCEDWEYWIRLAKNGATFFGVNEDLFLYRVHATSTSRNRIRMNIAQAYAKYSHLDFSKLDKIQTQRRFKKLMQWIIDRLLESNHKEEALKQIRIMNEVTERNNYSTIAFLMNRVSGVNTKYFLYIVKPFFGARALRNALRPLNV